MALRSPIGLNAEGRRDSFEWYPRLLRQGLPRIRMPPGDGSPDVVLAQTNEAGSYRENPLYNRPCILELSAEDQAWMDEMFRAASKVRDDSQAVKREAREVPPPSFSEARIP